MADTLKRFFAVLLALACLCACAAPAAGPSEGSAASGASDSAVYSSAASSSADSDASGALPEESSAASAASGAAVSSSGAQNSGGAQSVQAPASSQGGAASASKNASASASKSQSQSASQSKSQSKSQSASRSEASEITVTVTVDCSAAFGNLVSGDDSFLPQSGIMLSTSVTVKKDASAFEAIQAACQNSGLSLNYSGSQARRNVYIQGVGGLSEKDCGGQSGWKYSVNGTTPGKGCSAYTLGGGDAVRLYYAMS